MPKFTPNGSVITKELAATYEQKAEAFIDKLVEWGISPFRLILDPHPSGFVAAYVDGPDDACKQLGKLMGYLPLTELGEAAGLSEVLAYNEPTLWFRFRDQAHSASEVQKAS